MEKDETEKQTATREIFEETGIENLKFDDNFRQESIYIINAEKTSEAGYNVEKHVVYFLAATATNNTDTLIHDGNEISETKWVDFKKAKEMLLFNNSKKNLSLAYNKILRRSKYG